MADQNFTLTQEYLQSIFDYKDGHLYWKKSKQKTPKGKKLGSIHHSGYIYTHLNKKHLAVHRLIFLYHHGYLPNFIDHINRNKSDNRIENLRPATKQQNSFNVSASKANKSGFKGVHWHIRDKKWQVYLSVDGKNKHFGCYFDIEVAKFVAETMRYKYHKNFANNG